MITDVVMVERFDARNVLDLHSVYTGDAASIAPLAQLRVHFVPKDSLPTHAAWAPVRAADGSIPETVLLLGVSGAMLGAHAHLSAALRQKLADTRKAPADPKSLTPRVRRAIPAFIEGSHLRIEADEVCGGRRQVLEEALQLFALAEQIVGEDGDIFLVERLVRAAELLQRYCLELAAGRAFALLEEQRQSHERARVDLAKATVEKAAIMLTGVAEDGTLRMRVLRDKIIVWGVSAEPAFTAFARRDFDAAVVVQCAPSGNRVLVVAQSKLGPIVPPAVTPIGTLSLVAATLRIADQRARIGTPPTADPQLFATGNDASNVFGLNPGANAFGNLDPLRPMSMLDTAALQTVVRHALVLPADAVDIAEQLAAQALPIEEVTRKLVGGV